MYKLFGDNGCQTSAKYIGFENYMKKQFGKLDVVSVFENPTLVSEPTLTLLKSLSYVEQSVGVAKIDPTFSDTANFCQKYEIDIGKTVNCVVVKATRGEKNWYATCLIFGNTRADINGLVRRHLGARKVSFAPMEEAVALTKMEYGGITPVGLPIDWPIIVDKAIADSQEVVIGSGIRGSKLVVTGSFLSNLPNVVVLEGIGS